MIFPISYISDKSFHVVKKEDIDVTLPPSISRIKMTTDAAANKAMQPIMIHAQGPSPLFFST